MPVSRHCAILAAAALAAACHPGHGLQGPPPIRGQGAYEFATRGETSTTVTGTFLVLEDTIVVRPTTGACHYDTRSMNEQMMRFTCDGMPQVEDFALSFKRSDPAHSSVWSATMAKTVQKRVCDRYSTDTAGRQVCVASHIETSSQQVPVGGVLFVKGSATATRPGGDARR
jgi:hypothetical protein